MADRIARATMLIRRPVVEVFDAFVNPATITKFWLNATTGPLSRNARVNWQFMVPGATQEVGVTEFDEPHRIAFDWSDGIHVSIDCREHGDGATRIAVEVTGFKDDSGVDSIVDTTEGFSIVLCDLKTLLETGLSANLVRDKAELITESLGKSTK